MFVVLDGSVDLSDFVKGKPSIKDGFEVEGVDLDSTVIVLNRLLEVLFLAGLPAIRVQDVSLLQSILAGNVMLRETSIIE